MGLGLAGGLKITAFSEDLRVPCFQLLNIITITTNAIITLTNDLVTSPNY